jgi:hypothetical protein
MWAAATLDRVVDAEQHRAARDESGEQQAQQQARGPALAPARAIENAMVVDEPALAAQPSDPQQAGHGALARRKDRPDQQHLGVPPATVAEERGKGQDNRGEADGQTEHGSVSRHRYRERPVDLWTIPAKAGTGCASPASLRKARKCSPSPTTPPAATTAALA